MIKLVDWSRTADRSRETPLFVVSLYLIFFSMLGFVLNAVQRGIWGDWSAWFPLPVLPLYWNFWVMVAMTVGVFGLLLNSLYCTVRDVWRLFRKWHSGRNKG